MPASRSAATASRLRNASVAHPTASMLSDVNAALEELNSRSLFKSHAWLAELNLALIEQFPDEAAAQLSRSRIRPTLQPGASARDRARETGLLIRARSLFNLREYARVTHVLEGCRSSVAIFLRLYSQYMDIQQQCRGKDDMDMRRLTNLREDVQRAAARNADGYMLYLRGSLERRLTLDDEAQNSLIAACRHTPCNWGAWLELARCVKGAAGARDAAALVTANSTAIVALMASLFVAHVCAETDAADDARRTYERVITATPQWAFARTQLAGVLYALRRFDEAQFEYNRVFTRDPARLDGVDLLSNILFVKEDRRSLALLANRCHKVDRTRLQTCVVVGNYLSLRAQHERAVEYFRRALRLDPKYLSAWTLMGHEYVEMKNASAAIDAYRKAVDINSNDYRAWYALGQTYELMQMPAFTLYYFRQAAALRPKDARMWCAVGHTYEELERPADAARCYERAVRVGGDDAVALGRLAGVHADLAEEAVEKHGEESQQYQRHRALAAKYYGATLDVRDGQHLVGTDSVTALKYLARYYMDIDDIEHAEQYCERLLAEHSTNNMAQNLLAQLHERIKSRT